MQRTHNTLSEKIRIQSVKLLNKHLAPKTAKPLSLKHDPVRELTSVRRLK